MPIIQWIGKDKVVGHHHDVPFRTLEHKYGFRADNPDDKSETHNGNKIIHGDNLEALKALLPEYEGKVDCVYIDPPYNTGEEKWVYNDNVNDPQIKRWLGEVVGKEGEDLSRHDKWLCMMCPRLILLKDFLSQVGTIFISIDDNELASLKMLCDEIFNSENFVATFIWEKRKNRENRKVVSYRHDYILCYSRNKNYFKLHGLRQLNMLPMSGEALDRYMNPDNDPRGPWKSDPATAQAGHATENQFYVLVAPNGKKHFLPLGCCWRFSEKAMYQAIKENRIWFGENGNNVPRKKTYLYEKDRGLVPETILFAKDVSTNEGAKNNLKNIFAKEPPFATPKPVELIRYLLSLATSPQSIILDCFAGSGTTMHATELLNKQDDGKRTTIMIESMEYAESITAERIRRVMNGYSYKGKEELELYCQELTIKNILQAQQMLADAQETIVENKGKYAKISKPKIADNCLKVVATKVYDEKMDGLGGAFDYYELGLPLFNADGNLNEDVDEEQIRQYIYYSETHEPLTRERSETHPYLLDYYEGTGYFFYYEKDEITNLSVDTLGIVPQKAERYVIYADICTIDSERLAQMNIVFKKIPRDINRF